MAGYHIIYKHRGLEKMVGKTKDNDVELNLSRSVKTFIFVTRLPKRVDECVVQ